MIIKKKRLDKITGLNVQPDQQQYEESVPADNAMPYEQEQQPDYPGEQYEPVQEAYQPEENEYNYQEEYTQQENIESQEISESYENDTQYQADEQLEEQQNTQNEVYQTSQNEMPPEVSVNNIEQPIQQQPVKQSDENEINLFDLDNIDFSQRQERRRGDRRRGFRRVDDRNLVSRAREEADAIRESAQKEGYQAGLEQAQADIEEVRNSLSQFICTKQEVFDIIAPELLEISVEIAKKIIKKEIEQGPEVLFNTVVDVLKTSLSKEETKVTLRVNPAEVNEVKQAVPELINLAGIDTKIVVLSDEEVSEGGCQITTTNGIVDATLESRMRVVLQALREV